MRKICVYHKKNQKTKNCWLFLQYKTHTLEKGGVEHVRSLKLI